MLIDVRNRIVAAALWGYRNRAGWTYTMGAGRLEMIGHPFRLPVSADCSGSFEGLYNWAGAPDPSKLNYQGDPYTGTLIAAGTEVNPSTTRLADALVFGPGTGVHVAMRVGGTIANPLLFSHGKPGDPSLLTLADFGDWQPYRRWFTYDTKVDYNPPPPVQGSPASQVAPSLRPPGPLPVLAYGRHDPQHWVVYARACSDHAIPNRRFWLPAGPGGFGKLTLWLIKDAQRHLGLPVTGVVDLAMWHALGVREGQTAP